MTTPSRKLRHTAEASLTVFLSERGGGGGGGGGSGCAGGGGGGILMFCIVL